MASKRPTRSRGASDKGVEAYLAGVPQPARATLEHIRDSIRAALPEAEEAISYKMPSFKYRGRSLIWYAAFKNHCSLFPIGEPLFSDLKEELERSDAYMTGRGTLQFPVDKPLPPALVKKIVKLLINEIDNR